MRFCEWREGTVTKFITVPLYPSRIKSTETGNAVNGWQTVQTIGSFHDYVIALYDYVMAAVPCYLKGG